MARDSHLANFPFNVPVNDNNQVYDNAFIAIQLLCSLFLQNEKLFFFAQGILFIFSSHRKCVKQNNP